MTNKEFFNKGISFANYMELFEEAVAQGRTSGDNQDDLHVNYTKLNLHRSKRVYKHVDVSAELKSTVEAQTEKIFVIVLTEFWCGDAAQNVPMVCKALELSPNVEVKLVFRDENLELMDKYLTNGGRSIPKIIWFNEQFEELGNWGPRPHAAQAEMLRLKSLNAPIEKVIEDMQKWYNADKTKSLQEEILTWFK